LAIMKINLLISTIDEGILNIKNVILNPRDDVDYIVSHQYTREKFKKIPDELLRDDVIVSQIPGKGVARSRNNAIRVANGDIGLFADDDAKYEKGYFDLLKNVFLNDPDMSVALFKIKTNDGEPEYKSYPNEKLVLQKKLFSVSTLEMGIDIKKIKDSNIFFDERFGAGQENIIGSEETIFVEDCLDLGLKVVYFPEFIAQHPHESTINSIPKYDKRRNWVTGAYDCRRNGIIALPKALLGTFKYLPDMIKNRVNPFAYFYHRVSAVLFIFFTNRKYKNPVSENSKKVK
jgi:hypothetical protein